MGEKDFGFAIVGTGLIARVHAAAIQSIRCGRLVAVCSRDAERAMRFASDFECCHAFDNLDAMLKCDDVDILVVATPSGAHMEAAVAAARAGKHVLCEKPLDVSLGRIDQMIAAHKASGTRLGCTFQLRYMPALSPIRAAMREGRFGTLTYAGVYVPWGRTDDYYFKSSWHGTQGLDGGGALINQSIHMGDLLCDVLPPVESVAGFCSSVGHPGIETEDAATAILKFKGGSLGIIYGSTSAGPGKSKRLEISGTKGTVVLEDDKLVVFDFLDRRVQDDEVRRDFGLCGVKHAPVAGASEPSVVSELHAACFKDFMSCLSSDRPFMIDGHSARKSAEIVFAVYESARQGTVIDIDLHK